MAILLAKRCLVLYAFVAGIGCLLCWSTVVLHLLFKFRITYEFLVRFIYYYLLLLFWGVGGRS